MPEKHAKHEASGDRPMSIIERWPCKVEACRNHGQLCYYAVSDSADEHLPIHSVVMQYWLTAIARGECTVDVPPREILEQWQLQNLRALQRREERREERRDERAERAARKMAARKSSATKSPARKSSTAKSNAPKSSVARSSTHSMA
ncbi:hypothetical protein Q7P37_000950 [Cladosporium fusiforme]